MKRKGVSKVFFQLKIFPGLYLAARPTSDFSCRMTLMYRSILCVDRPTRGQVTAWQVIPTISIRLNKSFDTKLLNFTGWLNTTRQWLAHTTGRNPGPIMADMRCNQSPSFVVRFNFVMQHVIFDFTAQQYTSMLVWLFWHIIDLWLRDQSCLWVHCIDPDPIQPTK